MQTLSPVINIRTSCTYSRYISSSKGGTSYALLLLMLIRFLSVDNR